MATTVTEIAKKAGVSKALVSRLFNGDPTLRIAPETQSRLLKLHDQLGGIKNSRRANRRTKDLAYNIVFPVNGNYADEWTEFGTLSTCQFVRSLRLYLKSKGYRISFGHFNPSELKEEITDYINSPEYCDGLFLYYGVVDDSVAKIILDNKFPHVSSDFRAESYGVNTVTAYLAGAYRKAIQHLHQLGHKKIGFIGPVKPDHIKVYRYPAFAAALAENYLPNETEFHCDLPVFPGNAPPPQEWAKHAAAILERWLINKPPVTAVICKNDYIAKVLIDVMHNLGLKPGIDLSIIGYGNIELRYNKSDYTPVITTFDNPEEIIGRRCAKLLLMQIEDDNYEIVHEHIPLKFIVRQTTGKAR